jgi:hypothetical protein
MIEIAVDLERRKGVHRHPCLPDRSPDGCFMVDHGAGQQDMGLSLKLGSWRCRGLPVFGGLPKIRPFNRKNLVGTQDDRIGVLVLTLARLEFARASTTSRGVAPFLPSPRGSRFRRFARAPVEQDRPADSSIPTALELEARTSRGKTSLSSGFLLIGREALVKSPSYPELVPSDLRFADFARDFPVVFPRG